VQARRWILLCPFLDNKEVVTYVRAQGEALKAKGFAFLAADFEALVHSQEDFSAEIAALRLRSLGPPLRVQPPTLTEVDTASQGQLGARLHDKLSRAFPDESEQRRQVQAMSYIRSLLIRDNILDALRQDHPVLWERSIKCPGGRGAAVERARQRRPSGGATAREYGQDRGVAETRILRDLPVATITTMSVGTVSDWLIRCPLDFPAKDES